MKDDFEIINLDEMSLTQVNLEVEELEKELKKLQAKSEKPGKTIDKKSDKRPGKNASWDDLHRESAIEAKRAIDAMKPGNSVYKTNAEAYSGSDRNVADMLAEYDDISNTDKPRRAKKPSGAPTRKQSSVKPVKNGKKPVRDDQKQAKKGPKSSEKQKSVHREHDDELEAKKRPVHKETQVRDEGLERRERPVRKEAPERKEPEIQVTPVVSTTVKSRNRSTTAVGSVAGALGEDKPQVKKSRYQMEIERASRDAQLVYESNRSRNRSAAASYNARKEAEDAIAFVDDDLGLSSSGYGRTIDVDAKHAATAKGAPIMGGPRTANTGKGSSTHKATSGYDNRASHRSAYTGRTSGSRGGKNTKRRDEETGGFIGWVKGLSTVDYIIALTAILIVVAGTVVFNVFSTTKNTKDQIEAFVPLGGDLSNVGIAGESTLLAMANNRQFGDDTEEYIPEEEEFAVVEYEENEEEDANEVTVTLNMQSVVKDLKIKFVNKSSGKLIAGVPFEVEVTDAKGKTHSMTDEDKDGIIYFSSMTPGEATVKLAELSGYEKYKLSSGSQKVTVKESPDYKKIDVSDEVKTEKQVNAAVEDTAQQTQVESALTDTVEWVESTKTAAGSNTRYTAVSASDIAVPTSVSKVSWINRLFYGFKEITADSYIGAVRADEITPTVDPPTDPTPAADPTPATDPTPAADPTPTAAPVTPTPTTPAACNHNWKVDVEVPADCINAGYRTYTCSNKCGETKKETIAALGHNFVNGACSRCKTKQYNTSAKLYTKNGEQLYIKNGDSYKVATAGNYLDNPNQTFYKQSSEASSYKYTGWQEIDGHTYFFDKNGNKVTGEQVIQGAKYNFGSDGALQSGSGNLGIDVSKWNGSIDWKKVKNSGISYVIIRCGYRGSTTGALIEDPTFKKNIQGAVNAGLKVGVYFFSQATNEVEAIEEASMTLSLISGYKISYPIFLDVEPSGGRGDKIDSSTRTQVINAYCNTIRNSGYTAGVYANKSWLETKFSPGSVNGKIWLAQYAANPTYGGGYQMWQYTSKGSVSGISGNVDMNLSYLGY